MTREQFNISRKNRKKAREYFGLTKGDGYDLHHVDPSWRETDIERYIQWNPEDLIVLTHAEHTILHNKKRIFSDETRKKIGEAEKGNKYFLGKHHTEETKLKMSMNHKDVSGKNNPMYGRHWKLVDGVRVYY